MIVSPNKLPRHGYRIQDLSDIDDQIVGIDIAKRLMNTTVEF